MKATSDHNVEVYCEKCNSKLIVHENGITLWGSTIVFAYDVYCDKCDNQTPLFKHRIDAIKYYAKEYGMTYRYTD